MQQKPNFIFILADDLGYADLGCMGAPAHVSPRLDRMAREGLLFTNAYSNSPVCSPTRFALATGRYQYRLRAGAEEPLGRSSASGEPLGLPPEHPTFMSLLRDAGYATALVGKWHLGYHPEFGPLKSGYQTYFGMYAGAVDYFSHVNRTGERDLWEGSTPSERQGYLTDLLSDRAVEYVESLPENQPFMLSLHYTAPHWPWETRDDEAESRRIGVELQHTDGGSLEIYHRMINHMDEGIGRLLDALEARGLAENTLVVFTSDNGGERFSNNWPFVGQKMDLLEGGIRVPQIARWPARIQPGSRTETQTITMDWAATMLEAAGVEPHPDYPLDGVSLLALAKNPSWDPERPLFWRMLHRNQRAMVQGRWKFLHVDGYDYLFDIQADPRERANIAGLHPERLAQMRQAWEDWAKGMPDIPADARAQLVYGPKDLPSPTH